MVSWHNTGLYVASLEGGKMVEATIAGKRIGFVKKDDKVFAFAATCPHAGAPLCQGWLDPLGRIVCPDHKYRFDPANGRNTSGEGYKLFTYAIEIREGQVFVAILQTAG